MIHESHHRSFVFFICPRSFRSLIASLPANAMSSTNTFGPSSRLKVSCTVFGPPGSGVTSCSISAN